MTLSSRFNVFKNKIHFSYMDFAGYIEAIQVLTIFDSELIAYEVSITKNGVNFSKSRHDTLEDAFKFVEEYDKQLEVERK